VWSVERTIRGVDASRDELLPYVGPAAALPLYGALARLPHPVAVGVWTAALVAACFALVLAALALARAPARRAVAPLGAALLAGASGAVTSDVALGQSALLAAAGIACALLAYERAPRSPLDVRAVVAGAFATLFAGMQPNLALALVARMRDRAAFFAAVLGAAAFAVLTVAAGGGLRGFAGYVHRLGEHGRAERFITIQHTPAAIAWSFGAPAAAAHATGIACALAVTLLTIAVIVRARLSARTGTLLALAALPFAIPFFHEHDFVVELLPLIVLAATAQGRARALAGVAAVLIGTDWLDLAQRPASDAQIAALAFAVACGFVLLGRGARATRADLAPFAAWFALACAMIPLARAHPAPTWPDALPAAYRAPANADASAVWAGEQHAAGLDARDPAWGALRTLPLTGCILLAFAIVGGAQRSEHRESLAGKAAPALPDKDTRYPRS